MEVLGIILFIGLLIGVGVIKAGARKRREGEGCPKCHSHNLTAITKKADYKGSTFSNQVLRLCLNCGHKFA